jgi:lysophospholipase L1-like esterase
LSGSSAGRARFRWGAVTAIAIALSTACSHPTSPSPSPAANPRLSRSRFLAFGDSTTAGEVTVPITSLTPGVFVSPQIVISDASYPTLLGSQLASRYASQNPGLIVVNAGRSGEHVVDALPRFIQSYETERPEVVLLLDGYNDLLNRGLNGVDGAAAAIKAIVVDARGRGARVFLATMTPSRPDRQRTISSAAILAYNDRMRSIAAAERLVLVDLYAALLAGADSFVGVDGLHPTESGYRRIAETFFAAVVSDLEVK